MATIISRSTAYRMFRNEEAFIENYSPDGERLPDTYSLKREGFYGWPDGFIRITNPKRQEFFAVE